MVRAAVRPRMLVLLVVLLTAAAVCARLGAWQLERSQARSEQAAQAELAASERRAPADLADVLAPQTSFTGDLVGREVRASGVYEADGQLVVPDRALDGRDGFLVLTPLRVTADDGGAPAVLPVVRGWVASPDDAGTVPAGPVDVTGYLQASEAAGRLDTAAGTTESISSAQLVNVWGGPIYTGYLVLSSAQPAQDAGPVPLPPPGPRGDTGWDLRNLGYAVQWWIFGLFAVALWLRLVRDEALGEPVPEVSGETVPDGLPDRIGDLPDGRDLGTGGRPAVDPAAARPEPGRLGP